MTLNEQPKKWPTNREIKKNGEKKVMTTNACHTCHSMNNTRLFRDEVPKYFYAQSLLNLFGTLLCVMANVHTFP